MHGPVRRLLFLLCALVLFGAATIGLAAQGASANEPCGEHHSDVGNATHHHNDKGNCLTCCVGVCIAIPGLPPRPPMTLAPIAVAKIAYWHRGAAIAGRTIPPDPIPPRPAA